ncbi:SMP-30/gluconolactonase/LRE family protein [Parvularcula dongshanensis]|uniref:Sugar lactone lactonase YvrE n=1 Tax=Parvularcula dongshanensis TaxID=1173995 RepID=A0A840I463_9PROT|nr:sugar lactone lactonase YvrE [Parvularcula dongshanensis]
MYTIESGDTLGEGVLWRDTDNTVWWADIIGRRLCRASWPDLRIKRYSTPYRLCAFAFLDGTEDRLLCAFDEGFGIWDLEEESVAWISRPTDIGAGLRLNDGRVDPSGQFWAGSMHEGSFAGNPSGKLYRLNGNGTIVTMRRGLAISNGLCWSPDGKTVYHADSGTGTIVQAHFDPSSDRPPDWEIFVEVEDGSPDGAVTDSFGRLWVALWGKGAVACYSPGGEHLCELAVPAPHVTCPVFGGPGFRHLFVTSARRDLSAAQLESWPLSGSVFVYETDTIGMPSDRAALLLNS